MLSTLEAESILRAIFGATGWECAEVMHKQLSNDIVSDINRQDRIGVHPMNWSDRPAWIQDCDEGIRLAVTVLDAGGVETFQSCEGGEGHSFTEPTVEFHGTIEEGWRAAAWALTNGLHVDELRRVYKYDNSELHGPTWALTFRSPAHPVGLQEEKK